MLAATAEREKDRARGPNSNGREGGARIQTERQALVQMSAYDSLKPQYQSNLKGFAVTDATIIDLELEGITCAIQHMQAGNGNLAKYVKDSDVANLMMEVERLLKVRCGQGAGMLDTDRDNMTTVSFLMPELAKREQETLLNNVNAKTVHFSEQFPSDLSSSEQKRDFSIGKMIQAFNTNRPGVLIPTQRPSNQLLDPLLQFSLTRAGVKDNLFALTSHMPDFSKLAMKAGATEESLGGLDSKLALKKDGGEQEPRSIGAIGHIWKTWLRYAEAVMHVTMPDGSIYAKEAGFVHLEQCYADYASQRKSVAAVTSALNNGWKKLCDELVTSSDDFVAVCRSLLKSDIWVESANLKRANEATESPEVKKLKAEVASLKSRMGNRQPGYQQNGQEGTFNDRPGGAQMVKSTKPCFDFFAGKPCSRKPCPFRHDGPAPAFNPAKKEQK